MNLPQFKDDRCACHPGGICCRQCRAVSGSKWRQDQTGQAEFPCPYGLPMGWTRDQPIHKMPVKDRQPAKPVERPVSKAKKASPELVELRLAIPCDKREKGTGICLAGCKTCGGGKPTCQKLAEWRDCPMKYWTKENPS